MPGEQFDDAALAVDREGPLRDYNPARLPDDSDRDKFAQGRMTGADDAFEFARVGPRNDIQADAEFRGYGSERAERHPVGTAMLEARHERRGYSGQGSQIGLAQATPDPGRPQRETQPKVIHRRQEWIESVYARLSGTERAPLPYRSRFS